MSVLVHSSRGPAANVAVTRAALASLRHAFEDHPGNQVERSLGPLPYALTSRGISGLNPASAWQDDALHAGVAPLLVRLLSAGSDSALMVAVTEALKVMARNHPLNKAAILASGGTQVSPRAKGGFQTCDAMWRSPTASGTVCSSRR